jgi:hypothetical protein
MTKTIEDDSQLNFDSELGLVRVVEEDLVVSYLQKNFVKCFGRDMQLKSEVVGAQSL